MSTKKQVLAILASPRKHGNLAKMLDHAIAIAEKKGYEIHFINLYEQNIAYCKGCVRCKTLGSCYLEDDIKPIEKLLKTCDLTIMAAPTYFANIPAPAKNLFDRLVAVIMDDNDSPIPKPLLSKSHRYLLLTTCNTPFPFNLIAGQSTGCLHAMKEFFKTSGMKSLGSVTFAGTRNKTSIPNSVLNKIERKIPNANC